MFSSIFFYATACVFWGFRVFPFVFFQGKTVDSQSSKPFSQSPLFQKVLTTIQDFRDLLLSVCVSTSQFGHICVGALDAISSHELLVACLNKIHDLRWEGSTSRHASCTVFINAPTDRCGPSSFPMCSHCFNMRRRVVAVRGGLSDSKESIEQEEPAPHTTFRNMDPLDNRQRNRKLAQDNKKYSSCLTFFVLI
jgi:hypothetical protein